MSRNKRRGPQPLQGRARPIGPVYGLARSLQAVTEPVKHEVRTAWNEKNALEVVFDRTSLDRTRFSVDLLSLAAGQISLDRVYPEFKLTPAQRQPVDYRPDGTFDFHSQRQITDPEQWAELQSEGTLLIVSGCLVKMAGATGTHPNFSFEPRIWDVAEPQHHMRGRLPLPLEAMPDLPVA